MKSSISICIPTYNHGRYIRQAVDSALGQTVAPHEVVVSNNHSSDDTAEVLRGYGSRIRVVEPARHVTRQQNFEFCAAHSTGEWLCFLGSDDLLRRDYVERFEQGIAESITSDVVLFGGSERIDEAGRVLERKAILSFPRRAAGALAFRKLVTGAPVLLLDSVAIRRSAFAAVGGFGVDAPLLFDWSLYLRLSAIGSFYNLRRYLGRKRSWDGNDLDLGSLADLWLSSYMQVYKSCIAARLDGFDAAVRRQVATTLRRMFTSIIGAAKAQGRTPEDLGRLPMIGDYQALLGLDYRTLPAAQPEPQPLSFRARARLAPTGILGEIRSKQSVRSLAAMVQGWH